MHSYPLCTSPWNSLEAQREPRGPRERGTLARFSYRIQQAFTLHFGYTPVPTALSDDLYSFRGLGPGPRFAVEDFIDILLCEYCEELALPEAVVESVVFYRCSAQAKRSDVIWDGDATLSVYHLRHPRPAVQDIADVGVDSDANRQRASNTSGAPSSGAVLKLNMMTTGSYAHLIGEAHFECHSLSFPPGGPHAAPTIMDFLALVQLVSEQKANLKDRTTDRSATVVYAALEEIFGGRSKDELGRVNELGFDTKTTLNDDDSDDRRTICY
ncbi:hypothetical protein FB451DRAFT_1418022 [Mycena latifolia]|nr:hypothetical protein FB451DRAFT_1418022 [Mycena latifolia]